MCITEDKLAESYGKATPRERFRLIYKNYSIFPQLVDCYETGLFNRILFEVEYNRRKKNDDDLGVRIQTSHRSDPTAAKAIEHRSWEHCYKCFHDARNDSNDDYDYLSLQLAFYLASWGMYRGSSFLLQKDYKVHVPVVEELLKDKYDCLFGLECAKLRNKDVQDRLSEIESFMMYYYDDIRKQVKETEVKNKLSTTLMTKILMGTFGCVPAYDRYFIDGVKNQDVTTGTYGIKSLLKLVDFYESNSARLENVRKGLKVYDLPYPQMKLLDMGFWQIGFEKDANKGLQIPH